VSPVRRNSGPADWGNSWSLAPVGACVIFKTMIGISIFSRSSELVLPNDALLAVRLALDAILERIRCFRQQANDFEACPFHVFLMPIRRKGDRLTNCKFVAQPTAFVGQLAGPSSGPGCINRFRRDPSAETATTSKSGATSRNSVARTRNSTATAEKSVNPLDLQESLRSGTHCMTCDDPCRNTKETRPGPICRRWGRTT
jgi:hypothetical protein